jgi:hypothetical protein
MNRIILYTKDVQNFTGKSDKHARCLIKKIRAKYGKSTELPITIYEFCAYLKIDAEMVLRNLR